MTTKGFAIVERDTILIRTISDTEQAAMVNWLVTEARQPVWANYSELRIANMFDAWAFPRGAHVVPVEIKAT